MSENKKISVSKFIKEYKTLQNEEIKNRKIKGLIKRTYCPVIEKRMVLELMLKKSIVEDNVKYIDMFTNRINFIGAITSLYTYLLPDKDENDVPETDKMYDLLVEYDVLDKILECIGEKEITELTSINATLFDNWYATNTSTKAYISNLANDMSQKVGVVASVGIEKLAEVLDDETKMKKFFGALEKVLKKVK